MAATGQTVVGREREDNDLIMETATIAGVKRNSGFTNWWDDTTMKLLSKLDAENGVTFPMVETTIDLLGVIQDVTHVVKKLKTQQAIDANNGMRFGPWWLEPKEHPKRALPILMKEFYQEEPYKGLQRKKAQEKALRDPPQNIEAFMGTKKIRCTKEHKAERGAAASYSLERYDTKRSTVLEVLLSVLNEYTTLMPDYDLFLELACRFESVNWPKESKLSKSGSSNFQVLFTKGNRLPKETASTMSRVIGPGISLKSISRTTQGIKTLMQKKGRNAEIQRKIGIKQRKLQRQFAALQRIMPSQVGKALVQYMQRHGYNQTAGEDLLNLALGSKFNTTHTTMYLAHVKEGTKNEAEYWRAYNATMVTTTCPTSSVLVMTDTAAEDLAVVNAIFDGYQLKTRSEISDELKSSTLKPMPKLSILPNKDEGTFEQAEEEELIFMPTYAMPRPNPDKYGQSRHHFVEGGRDMESLRVAAGKEMESYAQRREWFAKKGYRLVGDGFLATRFEPIIVSGHYRFQ